MTSFLIIILTAALCGFFYRCRGGFIALPSTTLARFVWWDLPITLSNIAIMFLHGASWQAAGSFGLLTMIVVHVSLLQDQSQAIAKEPALENMGRMAQIMAMRAVAIALPVAPFAPWMLLLPFFGGLAGPIWFACWRYLDGVDSGIEYRGQKFADIGCAWAEFFTGVSIGAGIGLLGFVL